MDPAELLELLGGMVAVPSPAGGERPLAEWTAAWLADRHPGLGCTVDAFAPGRANLECTAGPPGPADLVLYGHLDTSLSGDPGLD
ncbi:MAG: deacylase, partial [Acidimicrobiales bacterium]